MSALAQFFLLAAIELAGLFAIWFLIRARVRRYLELENLLSGVRDEARALILELNETADRNVSLVEDRMTLLRELLGEVDRRIGVERRELETRDVERDVYTKLSRRRPIVPTTAAPPAVADVESEAPIKLKLGPPGDPPSPSQASFQGDARTRPLIDVAADSVIPPKSRREEALELHKSGFSPELIAARTGATVAEIELLIEMEERRPR